MNRKILPYNNGRFKFRVHVIRNPVAVPTSEEDIDGTTRRSPELVADSSRTAWKNRGTLKVTALLIIAPTLFARISPARGLWMISLSGIMGSGTRDST